MCFTHGQGSSFIVEKLPACFSSRTSLPRLIFLVPLDRHFAKYPELRHSPWSIAEPTENPFNKHLLRSWRYKGERHNSCSERPYNSEGEREEEQRASGGLSTVIDPCAQTERESVQIKSGGNGGTI